MKIAVYAPCKNEEKHIERWMEMSKDADVRLLADTGSTDTTISRIPINASFAPTCVHHISIQPFRFDTARNAALALLPDDVDICIAADLDEVLRPGWREKLEAAWKPGHNIAQVMYNTPGLKPFLHNSRVHARSGWHWRDPVHEGLYPWGVKPNVVTIPDFWIDQFQDKAKPRTQYLGMLAEAVTEEPWNSRRIFYYGRELMCYQHFELAAGWFQKYLEMFAADPDAKINDEVIQAQAMLQVCEGALADMATKAPSQA